MKKANNNAPQYPLNTPQYLPIFSGESYYLRIELSRYETFLASHNNKLVSLTTAIGLNDLLITFSRNKEKTELLCNTSSTI